MQIVPVLIAATLLAFSASSGSAAEQSGGSHAQAPDQNARRQPLSDSDKTFLAFAAEDNQAEIQLCLLAEKKAGDPALKAFARLMVNDHAAIESRLAALANNENYQLPDGVGEEGGKTIAKLKPLSGGRFDKQFLESQIDDHGHDIKKFSDEEGGSSNEGMKRFSAETLPILRQHLALAQAVQARMKQGE